MAHKERFMAAFRGEATEHPPAWEQAFSSDVAGEILGREAYVGSMLLQYQEARESVKGESAREDFLAKMEDDCFDLARALGWSGISYPWLRGTPSRQIDEFSFVYGDEDTDDWVIYRYDPESFTYGPVAFGRQPTWQGVEEIERKVRNAWDSVEEWESESRPAMVERIRRWQARCGDEFDYVAGAAGIAVPLNEEWMIACVEAPGLVAEYLDAQTAVGLKQLDVLASLGVPYANGGGDLASKNGPLYGPRFFHDVVMPRYRRIVDHARSLGIYYIFRSDGDLWSIADMLFGPEGAAAPAFNEIDYDSGMEIPKLQARYPSLTCVGNVPCGLLRQGTEDDVRAFVRDLKEQVLWRGRWVVASANTVLAGTPVRNVVAMLEEAGVL
ncbi:MAG: hypothetical protein HPY83_19350 [Anaerolineae bacterium]|nr:hypothetical protein [Anaerolineae bacterium]